MLSLLAPLRRFSPLGPLFGKELRVSSRRRRTYLLRFFYLACLTLVLFSVFAPYYAAVFRGGGSPGPAARSQRLAELGYQFFAVFGFFNLFAMTIAGPVLTSTAINAERLHKTLPVLLMTPITAWQIVAGKLFSRVFIALTLMALSLPAVAVVRLLGGIEVRQVLAVIAICTATLLFTASVGLLFSILISRAYAVILLSYGLFFLVWWVIPILLTAMTFAFGGGRGVGTTNRLFMRVNPFAGMGNAVFPSGGPLTTPWHVNTIVQLVLAGVTLVVCAWLVRRLARREGEGAAPVGVAVPTPMPAPEPGTAADLDIGARPVLNGAPKRPTRRTSKNVSDNPVLWREMRRPLFPRRWQRIAATALIALILGLFYIIIASQNAMDERWVQIPFAMAFCGIVTIMTCVLSATVIAQEKEGDTWTLLLATGVSPAGIIFGKALGLLRRMMWPVILIGVHFAIFTLSGALSLTGYFLVMWLIVTTSAVWVPTGVYFSLRMNGVTAAVMLNLLMPVAAYLGALMLFEIFDVAELLHLYAPWWHLFAAIQLLPRWAYGREEMPFFGDVSREQFILTIVLIGVGHLCVAATLLYAIARRFNTTVGRAPQTEPLPPARGVAAAV